MPKSPEKHLKKHLSDLQLAVMRVLWERGEATVNEVFAVVGKARGLAFTTIATILTRLEKHGVIKHRTEGRQYVYRALASENEVRRSMVRDLVQSLFQGDAAALVTHLLSEADTGELDEVKALLQEHEDKDEASH
jgi:predicted transcriptional regulator